MDTLLLTRSQVESLLDPAALIEPLRAGFIAYSAAGGERARRVRAALPGGKGSATVLFPGTTPGVPAYTVKVHAKFPQSDPAIRGVLCLHDLDTGALLAVMDSGYLTGVRTGICGALAAHTLAVNGADSVAIIGAGVQGTFQLRFLSALRRLRRASVFDIVPERAAAFAGSMTTALGLPVEPAPSLASALEEASIVLMATWSKQPLVFSEMVRPGTHITTLGPDEPGKAEVAAEVIQSGLFICDDRELAVELGALGGVGLSVESAGAELGEVFAGVHPGRTDARQITIYGGVGLAFQDTVAAWQVYRAAQACGAGSPVAFLR